MISFTSSRPETILPLWQKEFGATSSLPALTCSLMTGAYLLVGWLHLRLLVSTSSLGPIGSVLANIYGCNKVAMLGAFLAASGFLLSAIVYEPGLLCFTFGIIGGAVISRSKFKLQLLQAAVWVWSFCEWLVGI